MMTKTRLVSNVLAVSAVSLWLVGAAVAQTAAPAPAAPAAPMAPATSAAPAPSKARSAVSLDCSKQADAKGLHGKERKTFRSECKKNGGKPS